jgi:hypothetical protein
MRGIGWTGTGKSPAGPRPSGIRPDRDLGLIPRRGFGDRPITKISKIGAPRSRALWGCRTNIWGTLRLMLSYRFSAFEAFQTAAGEMGAPHENRLNWHGILELDGQELFQQSLTRHPIVSMILRPMDDMFCSKSGSSKMAVAPPGLLIDAIGKLNTCLAMSYRHWGKIVNLLLDGRNVSARYCEYPNITKHSFDCEILEK